MNLTKPRPYTVHHLISVKDAAARAGLSTKMFLIAAHAGQLGAVELMCIGRQQFVRASVLADFLQGEPADRNEHSNLFAPVDGGA